MSDDSVVVNGVQYVRADSRPTGNRCVVVVDRGWIFAGDVSESNGRITIARAVLVFRWEKVGFDGVLSDPKNSDVKLRKLDHDVDLPANAELFRLPVAEDWGL